MNTQQAHAAAWQRLARRTARRVNAGWWFSYFAPLLVAAGAAGCAVLLILRVRGVEVPAAQAVMGLGGAVLLAAGIAWLLARRRFCPAALTMVRLESQLGLNNALSTAQAGVRAWPEPPPLADDALTANLRRVLLPVTGAAVLVAAGLFFPVSPAAAAAPPPPPRSHAEIQSAIDALTAADLLRKEDIEKLQKQLDELAAQDPGDWYSHASQEAADSLREGLSQSLGEMAQNLEKGANSLHQVSEQSGSSPQEREQAAGDFQQAMKGLMNSPLGLNQKLMEQLSKIDPSKLKGLDQKQIEAMQKAMKDAAGDCKKCSGGGQNGEGEGKGKGQGQGQGEGDGEGEGNGDGKGEGKDGAGRGGVQRGPGVAPLHPAREASPQLHGSAETLESADLSRARAGDTFGVSDAQHHPDKSPAGQQSGGAVNAPGAGGDAIGAESLVPADRAVLKKFFQ